MESMRSNNLMKKPADAFGTFELPKLLAYPKMLDFSSAVDNLYCYVIKHYGEVGISLLLKRDRESGQLAVICGDWKGNKFDLTANDPLIDMVRKFIGNDMPKFAEAMRLIKCDQAQFYFALTGEDLLLVDMQTSMNKFASPGMIRDIFGKIYSTQEVRKIEVLDKRAMEALERGTGAYEGDLILKPSKFRIHHLPDNAGIIPFYVQVRR